MRLSTAAQQAACNAVVDLLDAGAGAGYIQIRSGPRPTTANDAATGTLLATLTYSDPAFGSANGSGVATASAITGDSSADNTGTASWARLFDSTGATVADLSVGTSGAEINLDSVSIVAGGTVSITSMTVTMPAGS